jgi:site-specific DNA-cytosine methylase
LSVHEFKAGFLFCGLGAGARGFVEAASRLGKEEAKFRNLGGIDNDPLSCEDFKTLTGGPAICADLSKMTPRELRKAWGKESPDAVFLSPPCKGFSGLLSKKSAQQEKYQKLNELVLQGMFLVCETWDRPPALLTLENVPRITTRGAELLVKVRQLLSGYGYFFHEATHDCGEIGGLAQHRRRYLLVARLPSACGAYVYRPSKKRVRACGEVLGELPLPEQPQAGELHRLPKLSWLNWVRLALIPAGGDWRDLPGMQPKDEKARKDWEQKGKKTEGETHWFKGKHGVMPWEEPARAVVGGPSNGASNVADPRLAEAVKTSGRQGRFSNQYKLRGWEEPAGTVTGDTDIQEGAQSVADPRLADAVGLAQTAAGAGSFKGRPGLMGVGKWDEPAPTVTGKMSVSGGNGTAAIADPRTPRRNGSLGVTGWEDPAKTVTGESYPSNGSSSVADPRVSDGSMLAMGREKPFGNINKVSAWDEPAGTVTASPAPSSGGGAVADPRIPLGNSDETRGGALGVIPWEDPAPTITGQMRPGGSNTPAAVADPRIGLDRVAFNDSHKVKAWDEPMGAVTSGNKGGVADPRLPDPDDLPLFRGSYGVVPWDEPAPCVRGSSSVRTSKSAVADPRGVELGNGPNAHRNKLAVTDWKEPAPTVIGATRPGGGAASVADPREIPLLTCRPRSGVYGVIGWEEAAATVTGSASIDNGSFAVADPRKPPVGAIPVIIAKDGTWHRPLTTLELAALQGLPAQLDGKPLRLAGKSVARWRERIGNAVPVQAARAIAETLLLALLAAKLGTWTLGSTGIWVRKTDGLTEEEANAPYEREAAA